MLQQLNDAGLERIAEQLMQLAQPAIRMRSTIANDGLPVGVSKLGGMPDLPPDVGWPTWEGCELSFVGQINLADVSSFSAAKPLPETGWLLFFYDLEEFRWGFDPDDAGTWAVLYVDVPVSELCRQDCPPDFEKDHQFTECALSFEEMLSFPDYDSLLIDSLHLDEEEVDNYITFLETFRDDEGYHQLLGHPHMIQNDMQMECQMIAEGITNAAMYQNPTDEFRTAALNWQLLLQFDTDDRANMMWGDMGKLYFWIRKEDLARRAFDQCWMILQCY